MSGAGASAAGSAPACEVLVVGGGLAGCAAALAAAAAGRRVALASGAEPGQDCASAWAQGGLAAALSPDDDPSLHAADTVAAGAGLVDARAAERLARAAPDAVRRLFDLGAPFDRDGDRFAQSLEAAHSRPRVVRVGGDGAGRAVTAAVVRAVREEPRIRVLAGREARALLLDAAGAVRGARFAPSGSGADAELEIRARAVVLATGGLGGLFAVTTNPAGLRGLGLALAHAAGAAVRDPEFVQFHPTALDLGRDPAPLATEALRGEGARLVNRDGSPFMARYDARAALAPRDVVARAVELERTAGRGAFLDARAAVGAHFPAVFPAVFAACRAAGYDPRTELVPVAPAAHYHMGGILADLDGRTGVAGLFAAGECASTGVHGANRLASNSLLEAVVAGEAAGRAAAEAATASPARERLAAVGAGVLDPGSLGVLRRAMSAGAGVARSEAGLLGLLAEISALELRCGERLELRTARLVAEAALARRESRGGHHRADHPTAGPPASTITPGARVVAGSPA